MAYDYFSINFTSGAGFLFLLLFLYANASLDERIKKIFYLMIGLEFVEAVTYSLELWTTTFETLSPWRLWLSAIGYSVRPVIFGLMLILAFRNIAKPRFLKFMYIPIIANFIAAFSVFFTDIVYSYTPDNQFRRGPLGYFTYWVVIFYLIVLMVVVFRSHSHRPKLEVLIIFAVCLLIFFAMAVEAAFKIRTVGRSAIIMATIFYYMFFQTQSHHATMFKELSMRQALEQANKIDGSTGVLNKKAFTEAAKALLISKTEPLSNFGFVFLDLDNLKKLNDTLGHAIGDIAIADVANKLQFSCRKTDLVGRFGGDEFCILLTNIPHQRFDVYLDDIQTGLQAEYTDAGKTVAVSASIGAVYVENAQDFDYEQLVLMADSALYEAKASGRNCHVIKEM